MPYLGDYLGQLLSEISMARMQADLETIRLAELYASHPLLRTMPVPHVRLPEVDMEIPVLIKASEEPRAGESARGGVGLKGMSQRIDKLFAERLSKAGIVLSANNRRRLRASLGERLTTAGVPTEIAVDVQRVADDLTSTTLRVVKELKPELDIAPSVAAELNEAARLEFLKVRTPPPRLTVLVTSSELRETGNGDNLVRVRLKVSEQGVEWTTIESEGVRRDRLVPE